MVGINSNFAASAATRNLTSANNVVSSSIARLSSGNRIIKASDDVAGLAIGTSISSTLKALEVANLNTKQAGSVLAIADGALKQVGDILSRQKQLSAQANSGSLSNTERGYLDQEFQSLKSEIDRIVGNTSFNGIVLLNGSLGSADGRTVSTSISYTVTGEGTSGTTGAFSFGGSDNNEIQGALTGATVSAISNSANSVDLIVQIGDSVFFGTNSNTASSGAFTLTDAATSQTLSITLSAAYVSGGVANQGAANTLAGLIEDDIQSSTVYQVRAFGTTSAGIPSTNAAGTILEGVDGSDITLSGTGFSGNTAPVVGTFSLTASTGTTDFSASTTIGGVAYSTTATTNGVVDGASGANITGLDLDDGGSGTGVLRLYKDGDATTNPNDYIDIDLTAANISGIDVSSEENTASLESALNSLFGIGNNGALSFQVGADVSDTIAVSISSVRTADIYVDDDGVAQTLSIDTQSNSQTAIEALDNAIASVISRRADVGAAISRFDFASASIEVSLANQDAARGVFLDADIAIESTNFATSQVKFQASVSVLAQANQQLANLLTLLQ